MPEVQEGEKEEEFMERCIPQVLEDGTATDQDQAVAICRSMYEEGTKSAKVGARHSRDDREHLRNIRRKAKEIEVHAEALGAEVEEQLEETERPAKSADDLLVSFGSPVKALGNGKIGGHLVRFGGPDDLDLEDEYFDAKTDFGTATATDLYYGHGLDDKLGKRRIGTGPAPLKQDDLGVWVEAQLNMADEYERAIYGLVEKGKLGWSSGTASHLVEREPAPKGNGIHIRMWPLGLDGSLTPIPCDPHNRAVPLKSLKLALPEVEAAAPTAGAVEPITAVISATDKRDEEAIKMDEDKTLQTPAEFGKAAAKAFWDEVKSEAAENKATILHVDDEADRAVKGNPWQSLGEMAQAAVKAARMPTEGDKRLLPLKDADGYAIPDQVLKATKAATGLGEDVGAIGGFLVGTQQGGALPDRSWGTGQILSRISLDTVGAGNSGMTYYGINETTRVNGGRYGGALGYWVQEGSAKTPSHPAFRRIDLRLRKACALVYCTDELLADATALGSYLSRIYNAELSFLVEDGIVTGTGAGQPLGILASPALVTVAIEAGQLNTTVVAENIVNMWARRYTGVSDYVWLINQDVTPQLTYMELPAGGGGALVYMPPGGLSGAQYGTIFGRPVIEVEYCSTLGTVGDVILCALSQYQGIQKGGVEAASSIHFLFDQDETTFRFVYRFDGQPTWNSAVTPHSGSTNTVSPFVTLAGRP